MILAVAVKCWLSIFVHDVVGPVYNRFLRVILENVRLPLGCKLCTIT